jgi:hypothetical protein
MDEIRKAAEEYAAEMCGGYNPDCEALLAR